MRRSKDEALGRGGGKGYSADDGYEDGLRGKGDGYSYTSDAELSGRGIGVMRGRIRISRGHYEVYDSMVIKGLG